MSGPEREGGFRDMPARPAGENETKKRPRLRVVSSFGILVAILIAVSVAALLVVAAVIAVLVGGR
jgi:hypothetical protein